jgi:UPF0271 protein
MGSAVSCIDLNADVGENPAALSDGSERLLVRLMTSANIACGGHAGDEASMRSVLEICKAEGVSVGAHPGFPDRTGFGRQSMVISKKVLEASLQQQIRSLFQIASTLNIIVRHVKPHGALYNLSATDVFLAELIAHAVATVDKGLVLVGLAGSTALDVWRKVGFAVLGEAFADRRYEPDGSLRLRKYPDAVIEDPREAARQALDIVCGGEVRTTDGSRLRVQAQTLCIHGDTTNAVVIAETVRQSLEDGGVRVGVFNSSPR